MAPPTALFPAAAIAERVRELGQELRGRMGDEPWTLLGVLDGSVLFVADLARCLGESTELSFLRARSYGAGTESSGRVELGELEERKLRGRPVVVADTILDTGHTLAAVLARVAGVAARVHSCVLFDKRSRREVDVQPDWVGFEAPDAFLVGYGLDHAGRFRTLPFVGILES